MKIQPVQIVAILCVSLLMLQTFYSAYLYSVLRNASAEMEQVVERKILATTSVTSRFTLHQCTSAE